MGKDRKDQPTTTDTTDRFSDTPVLKARYEPINEAVDSAKAGQTTIAIQQPDGTYKITQK